MHIIHTRAHTKGSRIEQEKKKRFDEAKSIIHDLEQAVAEVVGREAGEWRHDEIVKRCCAD